MISLPTTPIEELRRQLVRHFQEELDNQVQGPSETLIELVCDNVGTEPQRFPLFVQAMEKRKKAVEKAAGVPSRREGSAAFSIPKSPPLTSRGVTKHQAPGAHSENTTERHHIMGGYDGGAEVGYNGTWNHIKHAKLLQQLESARTACENEGGDDRFVTLGKYTFLVNAHGANCGAHYKYVIEGQGIKVYIHANPQGEIQPIRVRYGFESVVGRDFFAVHADFLEWLQNLGFKIEKECVSRIDFQVMLETDISELLQPVFDGRVVKRAEKFSFHGDGRQPISSYTAGSKVQICIYDKRKELLDKRDEVKLNLIVNECLGGDFPEHLTRVEFRLRREALKYFGVNTVQDLLEKEAAITEYLTFDWFRLLENEKIKGHEKTQAMAPIWLEVRKQFKKYFPGIDGHRKPLDKRSSRRELKCTGKDLIMQAVGCLSTAAAVAKGMFESEKQALAYCVGVLQENVKRIYNRATERVKELGIVRGIESPNALDWHLDPRYAQSNMQSVGQSFMEEFNLTESEQYDRFRAYAVPGCPF